MFDKNKFANILKKINETFENQTCFAKAADVNRTYLSQYMNLKLDSPPSPKVLRGIANASKNITTYDELMQICGHINLVGLLDIDLNDNELNTLTEMLLDYKMFLDTNNSFSKFDEQKYLNNFTPDSQNKIITAFRRNSLNLIVNKENDDNYLKFICEDDAMYPLLDIGDIALVYKQDFIENGATHLICMDNKNTIRKIIYNEDKFEYELTAMNGCYKPIKILKENISQIQILGKVVKSENKSAFK